MSVKIYYLENSGFAVILEHSLMVFDCYSFRPEGGGFEDGVIPPGVLSDFERVYFFVSHRHGDHFDPRIYGLCSNPGTRYIVAAGTPKNARPELRTALREGQTYADGYTEVYAGGSTDLGVSFAVKAEGMKLFHAGDLNCWHWHGDWSDKEEADARHMFDRALIRLKPYLKDLDVAFFPVDPRMKGPYDDGAREFIRRFSPKKLIPMHCQNDYHAADGLREFAKGYGTNVITYSARGELIEV